MIVIDAVVPSAATAHPDCSSIYQPVTQVVTGRAFNVDPDKTRIAVYLVADKYYLQPLDHSYSWVFPSLDDEWYSATATGRVSAILISNGFEPATSYDLSAFPQVDGVQVLASATGG